MHRIHVFTPVPAGYRRCTISNRIGVEDVPVQADDSVTSRLPVKFKFCYGKKLLLRKYYFQVKARDGIAFLVISTLA